MNCEEVAKHLTEYLDKNLDMAMTTRVATHVISCAHCRTESNELADCIQQVATLPVMEPPLGFAQRVMAQVRDSEPKASLWQRLLGDRVADFEFVVRRRSPQRRDTIENLNSTEAQDRRLRCAAHQPCHKQGEPE